MKSKLAIYSLGIALMAIKTSQAQSASQPPAEGKKPNIVFILMDNLGYGEVGCYGGGILRASISSRLKARDCSTSTSKRNALRAAPPF